eukprot:COSAG04_NODE_333_length_16525_cov_32.050527_1_plen_85_part_00
MHSSHLPAVSLCTNRRTVAHAAASFRAAKTSTWKTLPLPLPQLPLLLLLPLLIVALLLVSLCVLCVRSGAPVTHRRPLAPKSRC